MASYQGTAGSLDTIKRFMSALDKTKKKGEEALDEAVNAASFGRFPTMASLIANFRADLRAHGGTTLNDAASQAFLKEYCDIDLTDDDTGAITGKNAGGTTEKTASSVMPDKAMASSVPKGKTTIRGLTVTWPTISSSDPLKKQKETILKRLKSSWIPEAMKLIEESFGLVINKSKGSTATTMTVKFVDWGSSGVLATAGTDALWPNGTSTNLVMNINMGYFKDLVMTDPNGVISTNKNTYLDRTIAHELTHAIMYANILYCDQFPSYIMEGLAELVHGIDDVRGGVAKPPAYYPESTMKDLIIGLALKSKADTISFKSREEQKSAISEDYKSGYMLLRYLAKQGIKPAGLDYSGSSMVLGSTYTGFGTDMAYEINLANTPGAITTVTTLDATGAKGLIITGTNRAMTIKAGRGSDTIVSGKGNETITLHTGGSAENNLFLYNSGNGNDVITDFSSGKDVVAFYGKGKLSGYTTSGNDLVLKSGKNTITLKSMIGKAVDIRNAKGVTSKNIYGSTMKDAKNTFTYAENITTYYGHKNATNTIKLTSPTELKLSDTKKFVSIDAIDASSLSTGVALTGGAAAATLTGGSGADSLTGGSKKTTLVGGAGSDLLTAGKGGAFIHPGAGADVITLAGGKDTVAIGKNDGANTVTGYTAGKDVIMLEGATQAEIEAVGAALVSTTEGDVVLTYGATTLTLKNAVRKKISISGSDGVVNTKKKKGVIVAKTNDFTDSLFETNKALTAVTVKGGFSGTFDARKYGASDTVVRIDGTDAKAGTTLIGNSKNNIITAPKSGGTLRGGTGKDTLYAGDSADVIEIGKSDGADIVKNFDIENDSIVFDDGNAAASERKPINLSGFSTASSGTALSITLKTSKSSAALREILTADSREALTEKIGAGKNVKLTVNGASHYFATDNTGAIFTYETGAYYHGGTGAKDTLVISTASNVDFTADAANYQGVEIFDASASTGDVTFTGGKGVRTFIGGTGKNVFTGGAGAETFVVNGSENTITNYGSGKDVIKFSTMDSSMTLTAAYSAGDVTLTDGTSSVVVKGGAGSSFIVSDKDGTIKANKTIYAAILPTGMSLDKTRKTLTLTADFTGEVHPDFYSNLTTKVDASKVTGRVTVYGTEKNNTILGAKGGGTYTGGAGNDTLTLVKKNGASDTVVYSSGDGKDTVKNFEAGIDLVELAGIGKDGFAAGSSGSSAKLMVGDGVLTLANLADAKSKVSVKTEDGVMTTVFGRQDKANTFLCSSDVDRYYGSATKTDTVRLGKSSGVQTVTLTSDKFKNIDVFDASKLDDGKKAAAGRVNMVIGDFSQNVTVKGGDGRDTFTREGGTGAVTYWFGKDSGADTIIGSKSIDSIYLDGVKNISDAYIALDGSNLSIAVGSSSLTVKSWTTGGLSGLTLANGTSYYLKNDGGTLRATRRY